MHVRKVWLTLWKNVSSPNLTKIKEIYSHFGQLFYTQQFWLLRNPARWCTEVMQTRCRVNTDPKLCMKRLVLHSASLPNVGYITCRRRWQYTNILIYIQQDATLHRFFIWKLLYMFRVVPPPIIRNANNCIYRIWYLSHRYCYLPLAAGSSNGVTNTRCCRYSCLLSWWWVMVPPETCRAVPR